MALTWVSPATEANARLECAPEKTTGGQKITCWEKLWPRSGTGDTAARDLRSCRAPSVVCQGVLCMLSLMEASRSWSTAPSNSLRQACYL